MCVQKTIYHRDKHEYFGVRLVSLSLVLASPKTLQHFLQYTNLKSIKNNTAIIRSRYSLSSYWAKATKSYHETGEWLMLI